MNQFTVFAAQYLVWAAPLTVIVVWFLQEPKMRRVLFLRAICVGALCTSFAKIAGMAFMEHRPFVVQHVAPMIPHIDDNSFPSDHTIFAFGCAFLLIPFSIEASVFLSVVGLIIAWARIATLLHSPLDIVASILLAAIAALLAKVMIRRTPKDGQPGRRRLAKMAKVRGLP